MTYYRAIGDQIRTEMERKELSARFLGSRLYEHLHFRTPEAAKQYITWVRKGSIYGGTSSKTSQKQQNVDRLAILLYAVGLPEDHLVVRTIHSVDARFVYPPVVGVPYEILRTGQDLESRI